MVSFTLIFECKNALVKLLHCLSVACWFSVGQALLLLHVSSKLVTGGSFALFGKCKQ